MKRLLSLLLSMAVILGALTVLPPAASAAQAEPLTVPQIRITTEDGNGTTLLKEDGYVDATIEITDTDGSVLSSSIQFKVRGNSTAFYSILKKAFTFKFGAKRDVLGMGKGKKWALIANAMDPSLLRNYIAVDFAHEMGLAYTSEQKFVELWLDGSYRGCYTLMEPVQEGKDRVNIDIDSNGGKKDFLIEREENRVEEDVSYFKTDGIRWAVSEPEEPNDDQLAYIRSTMDGIVAVLKSGDRAQIEEKIDVASFTRFYLLNELYKTLDFDYSSVFFYYQDGKLYAGPVWDYDLSTGNMNPDINAKYKSAFAPDDALFCEKAHLYRYLCSQEWFVDEVKKVYRLYEPYISGITAAGGLIDTLTAAYGEVFNRNYTQTEWRANRRWLNLQNLVLPTFEANVEYLRDWLSTRNEWLMNYYDLFGERFLFGDADADGKITILDATKIQRVLAALIDDPDGRIALRGNIMGDTLDILDATLIQRFLVGIAVDAPFGSYFDYKPADET